MRIRRTVGQRMRPCAAMTSSTSKRVAIIGGGPAGLMAAEQLIQGGVAVDLYDSMGSVGRKFLLAGKGGLNLTHAEPFEAFAARYGERREQVTPWLRAFDANALRAWAYGLGVSTFVGSSQRVFPMDLKAAPLLRRWLHRLRESGVRFHVRHRWLGWTESGALRFATTDGDREITADATVLALGGASWPQLGSTGAWVPLLREAGAEVAELVAANGGFECTWSEHLRTRFAGAPIRPVVVRWLDAHGQTQRRQGEFVLSEYGVEGSLIYAIGADVRAQLEATGEAWLQLDLVPDRPQANLAERLAAPRGKHSIGDWLRRRAGLDKAKIALAFELIDRACFSDPAALAAQLKALSLRLHAGRLVAEAISTAGGVRLESLDEYLMLRQRPGVFCAGEMLDWEAPTGGYLLSAGFASGVVAGRGVVDWLGRE